MLVNSIDRFHLLERSRSEVLDNYDRTPTESFYSKKLASAWSRARRASAYRSLGEFNNPEFRALPVTSKDQLKAAPAKFMTADMDSAAKYYETTGTTGLPTPTPRHAADTIWNVVSVAEAWRRLFTANERVLIMVPSDVVPVADMIVGVCEYLGIPHVRAYPFATGICDWDRIIGMWEALQPTTIFVAPGVALQFSRLLRQRGALGEMNRSVSKLMLLGEVSTPAFRGRLGQWWDAHAFDASYGSTETGTLAATCRNDRLHLLSATNYFELALGDEVVPLPESGTGRLIVTPLNMSARALLRLDTGDSVTVSSGCGCGSANPVVVVLGRSSDALTVRQVGLDIRGVEEVVYGATEATGYLIEADASGQFARLLLERDVFWDRATESETVERLQRRSRDTLHVEWDEVLFVNQLPAQTKSGASQKSWKRSNFRVLETSR
ncbi:hypothetical protein ACFWPH_02140 [Nocardia sp. NPDC058499]|uniref:hypothetical protein n=1 Tax=Nocardia sp. NPDC058499 TaxID=3346530 RepID=UPI00364ABFEA